jgi:hypothetical protein
MLLALAACKINSSADRSSGSNGASGEKSNRPEPTKNEPPEGGMTAWFLKAASAIENGETVKMDWPASDFPAGHPAYPDGEVSYTNYFLEKDLFLLITDTGKPSYESYIKTLQSDGWLLVDDGEEEGVYLVKGTWSLGMSYYEDYGVGMYVSDTGRDLESLYMDYDWPEKLPDTIPVYPYGKIAFTDSEDEFDVYSIAIENSSKAELEKYINTLVGLGWTLDEKGDYILDDGIGVWTLTAFYDEEETDGTYLVFGYLEKYNFEMPEEG